MNEYQFTGKDFGRYLPGTTAPFTGFPIREVYDLKGNDDTGIARAMSFRLADLPDEESTTAKQSKEPRKETPLPKWLRNLSSL